MLNLALLAAVSLLVWQLKREWSEAQARQQALMRYRIKPAPAPDMPALPKVIAFEATAYSDIAQNNLFSRDRNPDVIVDPPPPPPQKPVPPFPVARGVMLWGGAPPTIVLSEKSGAQQRAYHPGETMGPWKILSIDDKYVVFSWDGKEFKKRIDELLDKTPVEVASAAPAAAAQRTQTGNVSLGSTKSGPGVDMGSGVRSCVPGDNTPAGAVVDGMKKVVTASPFGGAVCRWEPVK